MAHLPGRLTIAAVGKLRTPHWRAAQADYLERLRRYIDVELVEVRDVVGTVPDDVAVAREGESLLGAAADIPWIIVLDAAGKHADSVQLAGYVRRQIEVYHHLGFLIGGPVGLSDDVIERGNERLSLSRLTFPHELARVILLEQLYRAATIMSGEHYHK